MTDLRRLGIETAVNGIVGIIKLNTTVGWCFECSNESCKRDAAIFNHE